MKTIAAQIGIALISVVGLASQPALADKASDELEQVRANVSSKFEEINP